MSACPGCGGQRSTGAHLCMRCRTDAIALGVGFVEKHGRRITAAGNLGRRLARGYVDPPRTAGQNSAYHGRCGDLARLRRDEPRVIKAWALEHASELLGRTIESSAELSQVEMSDLLDWLEEQITAHQASQA